MSSKGVMGLFDYFRSSYDLGPDFTDVECQTKDIEELGGFMSFYWLSPDGHLYSPDFGGTYDYHLDSPETYSGSSFNAFKVVGNGKNGAMKPAYITRKIKIISSRLATEFWEVPEMELEFREGKLVSYSQLKPTSVSSEHPFWQDE